MLEIGIPLYNARATLDRALSSIVAQTERRRVLVTLCDDCSTETYDDIIARYSPLLNLRILRTSENGGAGIARNEIIRNACGDFLMFLDADDALGSPLSLKKALHEIYRARPDITFGLFVEETPDKLIEHDLRNMTWMHGKIWKTSFLQENKIVFPPIRYNEDSAFCTLASALTEDTITIDFPLYCWINYANSTVRGMEDYYMCGSIDFLRGREFVYWNLLNRGLKDLAEKDLCHNMVSIYYIYINLLHKDIDAAEEYLVYWGDFLNRIQFTQLLEIPAVRAYMANQVNNHPFIPRYGVYSPDMGLIDFLNKCLEAEV